MSLPVVAPSAPQVAPSASAPQADQAVAEITAGVAALDIGERNRNIKARKEASKSPWDRRFTFDAKKHIASFLNAKDLLRFQLAEDCLKRVSLVQTTPICLEYDLSGKFVRVLCKIDNKIDNKMPEEHKKYLKKLAEKVVSLSPYFHKRPETEQAFVQALPYFTKLQTLVLSHVGTGTKPTEYLPLLPPSVTRLKYECNTIDQLRALAAIPTLDQLDIELRHQLQQLPIIPYLLKNREGTDSRDILRIAARVTILSAANKDFERSIRRGYTVCYTLDEIVTILPHFKSLKTLCDFERKIADVFHGLLQESPKKEIIEIAKKMPYIDFITRNIEDKLEEKITRVMHYFEGLKSLKLGGGYTGSFFDSLPLGLESITALSEPTLISDENLKKLGRLPNLRSLEIESTCLKLEEETLKALPKSLQCITIVAPHLENIDDKVKFLRARGVLKVDI
jgi:hypothetical protein